jgi:hypothetical protein
MDLLAYLAAVQPMWMDPPEAHLGQNHAQEHHAKRPAQQQELCPSDARSFHGKVPRVAIVRWSTESQRTEVDARSGLSERADAAKPTAAFELMKANSGRTTARRRRARQALDGADIAA